MFHFSWGWRYHNWSRICPCCWLNCRCQMVLPRAESYTSQAAKWSYDVQKVIRVKLPNGLTTCRKLYESSCQMVLPRAESYTSQGKSTKANIIVNYFIWLKMLKYLLVCQALLGKLLGGVSVPHKLNVFIYSLTLTFRVANVKYEYANCMKFPIWWQY